MEEIINTFKSTGKAILEEITDKTIPIRGSPDNFINACIQSIQSKDPLAILGICFNFAPYVSYNFEQIDKSKFWEILINLSPFINEPTTIYGYLEAVAEMTIKSRKISDEFLLFLKSNTELPNVMLKPLLLTAVFDYLPSHFIFHNTDYFLPLVLNAFQINDFLYRSNFLLILSRMNLNVQTINSIPNFSNIIWNFIFETSLSDTNFPVLSNPMEKFRELVPDFFDLPNEVISQKLQLIDESNLYGLIRLLPFLNPKDFQCVFEAILSFVSTKICVQKKINEAIFDSLVCNFNDQATEYMFSFLSKNLIRLFDDVSIYIYSLYYPLFEDVTNDAGLYLIKSINLAFSSAGSNKSILCFAISQIAEQYKTRSNILHNSVIPAIINTFALNDNECSRYASKALAKLYQTGTVQLSSYLSKYLLFFDEHILTIPNYSLYCLKKYFKVLGMIIDMQNDPESNEKIDKSLIFQFVQKYACSESMSLEVKAFILDLCTKLSKAFSLEFEEYDLNDICLSLTENLLQSNISFSYPIVAEYILFSEKVPRINEYFRILVDISLGKMTNEPKIIRVTSYLTAMISSEYDDLHFPVEIIAQQLSVQNEDTDIYQSRAINNLQFTFSQYDDATLNALLQRIIQISKVSRSSNVVDDTFVLLKYLIKEKTEFAFPFASDLILSTIQGRISLLDHNFPFNYDHSKFKFYKCLSSFISHYKAQSANIILELIDWIPLASEDILPKIIKPINRALAVLAIPSNGVPILWNTLLVKLRQDWHNTDLANYLLGCLVNLLIDYPTICNSDDLISQMKDMWEANDDEMVLILPQIFFDIWANTDTEIPFDLYHKFTDLLMKEEFKDWCYPLMIKYLIKIVTKENKDLDDDYYIDAASVIARFLLKDDNEKQNLEFNDQIISEMKNALTICNQKCEMIKDKLFHDYSKYPGKVNTLSMIL